MQHQETYAFIRSEIAPVQAETFLDLDISAGIFGFVATQLPERIAGSPFQVHSVQQVKKHHKLLLA